ncbi:MAG: hypothetical protein SVR94_01800 [Pseudomonadota bacterium]|nr:hypothetical protein [Pseudomonadota bacterium]
MKKIFLALSALLLAILSYLALADNVQLTLGKNTFCIPKRYSILNQTSGPLFTIKGADTGPYGGSFQVAIDPPEIKQSIPDYLLNHGDLPAVYFINVRQAPKEELKRILDPQSFANILQLKNDYENAHVEYDRQNNFYRVSDFGFPPPFVWWEVIKIKPDKKAIVPENINDYYLASCIRYGGTTATNGNSSNCEYSLEIDGYLVEIKTTENNLHLKPQITAFSKKLLALWQQNCNQ